MLGGVVREGSGLGEHEGAPAGVELAPANGHASAQKRVQHTQRMAWG